MMGYLHPGYADSLAEFGKPRFLPNSDGWILERQIPGTGCRDAIGCYPIFACQDWSQLSLDLEDFGDGLVCLAIVTDPFGRYNPASLQKCFPDIMIPFKKHFIVDLNCNPDRFVSSNHRRNLQTALREVTVEVCLNPERWVDEWVALYANLIKRHNIQGIRKFSRPAFVKQFTVPGLTVFRAIYQNMTVGMMLWYSQEEIAYYHLGACNTLGYETRASFAITWYAIQYFTKNGLQWLDLGGEVGVEKQTTDGLARFKQGWSTGTATSFFCGRIFDASTYAQLCKGNRFPETHYFPAYRFGEFR